MILNKTIKRRRINKVQRALDTLCTFRLHSVIIKSSFSFTCFKFPVYYTVLTASLPKNAAALFTVDESGTLLLVARCFF